MECYLSWQSRLQAIVSFDNDDILLPTNDLFEGNVVRGHANIGGDGSLPLFGNTRGSISSTHSISGWDGGVCTTLAANATTMTIANVSNQVAYIKNTGYKWVSGLTENDPGYDPNFIGMDTSQPVNDALMIKIGVTGVCWLPPGEGMIIPHPTQDWYAMVTGLTAYKVALIGARIT